MKALVTGGGGFLGRYIVEKLAAQGYEVTSLSRNEYPELEQLGVQTVKASVTDKGAVAAATKDADVVFHTASKVGIWGDRNEFYKTNVTGAQNVIEACIENHVSKLVYTSSPSVVFDGTEHKGIDESRPYPEKFMAHYPETKAIAERNILEANGKKGLYTCSLRPHLIWGPRDTNLIPRLIQRAKSGRLRIVGDGTNIVDTVYVENAADAHLLAAERLMPGSPVAGSAYFITQGEPVNCWDWINELLEHFGMPRITKRISAKTAYRAGAAMEFIYGALGVQSEPAMTRFLSLQLSMSHYFNPEKAKTELGYAPAVGMREGMDRLVDSLKK